MKRVRRVLTIGSFLAISIMGHSAFATDAFLTAPAYVAFTSSPSSLTWDPTAGVLLNKSTTARDLYLPLVFQSKAGWIWNWYAKVNVGGTGISASTPASCTLYVVSAEGLILANSGAQTWSSPTPWYIEMSVPNTGCTSAFVYCLVPSNAWLGNIQWSY